MWTTEPKVGQKVVVVGTNHPKYGRIGEIDYIEKVEVLGTGSDWAGPYIVSLRNHGGEFWYNDGLRRYKPVEDIDSIIKLCN